MFFHAIWLAYIVYTWVCHRKLQDLVSSYKNIRVCWHSSREVSCSTPDLWRSTYRAVCTTKYVPSFKMSEIFLFRLHFEGGHGNQTSGYSTDPLAEVLLYKLNFQPCVHNTHQSDHLKLLPRQSGSGGVSNMSYGCWFFNLQVASFRLIY